MTEHNPDTPLETDIAAESVQDISESQNQEIYPEHPDGNDAQDKSIDPYDTTQPNPRCSASEDIDPEEDTLTDIKHLKDIENIINDVVPSQTNNDISAMTDEFSDNPNDITQVDFRNADSGIVFNHSQADSSEFPLQDALNDLDEIMQYNAENPHDNLSPVSEIIPLTAIGIPQNADAVSDPNEITRFDSTEMQKASASPEDAPESDPAPANAPIEQENAQAAENTEQALPKDVPNDVFEVLSPAPQTSESSQEPAAPLPPVDPVVIPAAPQAPSNTVSIQAAQPHPNIPMSTDALADEIVRRLETTRYEQFNRLTPIRRSHALLDTKLGGPYYIPPEKKAPCNLNTGNELFLLAQINFSQIPKLRDFPEDGLLQFFIDPDPIGFRVSAHPTNQISWRIRYIPTVPGYTELSTLSEHHVSIPSGVTNLPFLEDTFFPLHAQASTQLCSWEDFPFQAMLNRYCADLMPANPTTNEINTLRAAKQKAHEMLTARFKPGHAQDFDIQMGGFPTFSDSMPDPRSEDPRFPGIKTPSVLLLQLPSFDNFRWPANGIVHFFISRKDLKAKDFNHVYFDMIR
ncbi:MAG: DUF1963 domain-containing protein [Proteobacteria bacterium]|nr:DUF1963 domain-containing protein [Pseudomonadota bacterium]